MSTDFSRRNALTRIVGASASVAIGAEVLGTLPATAQPQNYYPPGNVLNFGADPTGQHDSAAAIQAAINYASSSSIGGFYVPGGVYLIDQPTSNADQALWRWI